MKLGLINSAWAQAGRDTSWGIQKTKELGFDTIDIFTDPLDIDIRERRLIKDECDRVGLPIVSICCVAVGLIDFNPSVQRFSIDRVKAYLDLAYEYQAKNVLLVLGEYIWAQEVIPPAEQWKTGVDNCRLLAEYAESLGVQIALELEPFPLSLLNTGQHRHLAPLAGGRRARRTSEAGRQSDPRSHLRLRRQSPRRSAARSRSRQL